MREAGLIPTSFDLSYGYFHSRARLKHSCCAARPVARQS